MKYRKKISLKHRYKDRRKTAAYQTQVVRGNLNGWHKSSGSY